MTNATPTQPRSLPWDWHPGVIPANVVCSDGCYIETSYSFLKYRSARPCGANFGIGSSMYKSTMLDIGPEGAIDVGAFTILHGARIVCDGTVTFGEAVLVSWNVVVMDNHRAPRDAAARRESLRRATATGTLEPSYVRPVRIESNVWIGFDSCILPGVTIGEGSIVAARSVVDHDVPPYTIVAGNPARPVRGIGDEHSRRAVADALAAARAQLGEARP